MTGNPASASVLALAGCLVCLSILSATGQVRAQPAAGPAGTDSSLRSGMLHFDIPVQWLGDALDHYSRLTGLAVLIDSGNAQRRSTAVSGIYTAAGALQILLTGTGLQARYADARSIIVDAEPGGQLAAMLPDAFSEQHAQSRRDDTDYAAYIGRVQQSLRMTLCASPRTRPGRYRLALQLRLNADGAVDRFRLLGSTGNAARDTAVMRAVQALDVGLPPPAAMPQPVSILLLPEAPDARTDCAATAGER